jgi:hypothetical protein
MNAFELVVNFTLNLVSGIVGILIVLWIERQRRPSLTIKLGKPGEIKEGDILKRKPSKWLHVQVHNRNVPKWLAWVYHGEPALTCRAWITFHHLDGQRLFDREMVARWSGSDEPKVEIINTDKGQVARLIGAQNSFDIPPGEQTDIDVVFRAKSDNDCFGWNNESYLYDWRHPGWHLEKGRYIAKIRVKTGGREYVNAFLIANDVPFDDFRLIEVDDEVKKKLR